MVRCHWRQLALAVVLSVFCLPLAASELTHPDHDEFEAALSAPFRSVDGERTIVMHFRYPYAGARTVAAWQVDIVSPAGEKVWQRSGFAPMSAKGARVALQWDEQDSVGQLLASGYYTVRMRAAPSVAFDGKGLNKIAQVESALATFADELEEQQVDVMLGELPKAKMPAFDGLALASEDSKSVPANSGLPYTIYYGNLHSQTNHSDGGTPVASCGGSESPQAGDFGPTDAYAMMDQQAGGDFLLTSEHNHMFDGSTGTNSSASPATAIALFDSGVAAATSYRNSHAGFVAMYGLEWGVISNGGHLNLLNPDALAEWETNGSGQLIGEVLTPKSDYPALYATMKQRGWIGQFNHPKTSGQFLVNGVALGYDSNGRDVMMLTEVLNSSAFSTNTSETETSRSSFVGAWNRLLEAGYHVAPTSNQDNHCANWGLSFTNRTGVLLANSASATLNNFLDGIRARRVFATEDRTGQVVLTGNGHVMGESFANSGSLTLSANYASLGGRSAQRVQFYQGVPGRNGTVTQLNDGNGTYTFTPSNGEHFYYALVTQDNGLRLWSAPIWVSQGSAPVDTTAPTVSASESGSSGSITFSASASDNVGVTSVAFYVDGSIKGSDASAPYSLSFDSTTLSDGSHSLTARASDAAGNVGISSAVSFTVSNTVPPPSGTYNEVESNGSIAAANAVARSFDNIVGTMGTSTDKDYFKLDLTAGESVQVAMVGPSGSTYDYDLYLFTASGTQLAQSISGSSNESVSYTNGSSAQSVYAEVISYKGSSSTQIYTLTPTYSGGDTGGGGGNGGGSGSDVLNESESNGSVASANTVADGIDSIVGTMGTSSDKDYFRIDLAAGEAVSVGMVGPSGNTYDYDLYLVTSSDATLKSSTSSSSNESLNYTNGSSAQTVYAKVISYKGSSSTQIYTLTLGFSGGSSGGGGGSTPVQLVGNGDFESGNSVWSATSGVIDSSSSSASHGGSWKAWLCGYGSNHTDSVQQTLSIPSGSSSATLSFWLKISSDETSTSTAFDTLKLQVRSSSGSVLGTLNSWSNLDENSSYQQQSFDLSSWAGQTVQIYFEGAEGAQTATSFLIDDVSLIAQ